ncbi:hypothetical protein GUITHDRAFT_175538 [Guillardia theta CCMP2712]|uniref:Roc domain-containing protein n=1 Tax=Guillardia theta (strain CCMP2712) TaxID=905079 RepID=L1IAC9_GUITC|nr:hypothetical protein GUITHDRAFT_175538 [Guillardia theta CCMP2712]EKX32844.1 hypothetical protein GUITHDRAFT_175538 [Guillardia theta CCMP2712]|eukprot:XP_005819824.1 hypothetical protein GUITHDRAFT_175538 [Guillardia theta CCMP2712]
MAWVCDVCGIEGEHMTSASSRCGRGNLPRVNNLCSLRGMSAIVGHLLDYHAHWTVGLNCCICVDRPDASTCQPCRRRRAMAKHMISQLVQLKELQDVDGCMRVLDTYQVRLLPTYKPLMDRMRVNLAIDKNSNMELMTKHLISMISNSSLDARCTDKTRPWLSVPFFLCAQQVHQHFIEFVQVHHISSIDLSDNPRIEWFPALELLSSTQVQLIKCSNCPQLITPPMEIANQGSTVTMKFLRELLEQQELNETIHLSVIGEGEAGKTSLLQALQDTENDRSPEIPIDTRTVGVDITRWDVKDEHLQFLCYDLGGQKVYMTTHQYFVTRRSLNIIVWKPVRTEEESRDISGVCQSIVDWLDLLQCKVPGATILLVVTHSDSVSTSQLDSQCAAVKATVQERLKLQHRIASEETPPLDVLNLSESFGVDSISGKGIPQLRQLLVDLALSSKWYHEPLPRSWLSLIASVRARSQLTPWLSIGEFVEMVKEQEIDPAMTRAVTVFLHETSVLRYFGRIGKAGAGASFSMAAPSETSISVNGGEERETGLCWEIRRLSSADNTQSTLSDTVFISIPWMVSVFKGLIRHEHDAMLSYFHRHNLRELLHHGQRLRVYGSLHRSLAPFLWPRRSRYWEEIMGARAAGEGEEPTCYENERRIWEGEKDGVVIGGAEDELRAFALLTGFQLVSQVSHMEFLVPDLLAPQQRMAVDASAFSLQDSPFWAEMTFFDLPAGFLREMLIRYRAEAHHADVSKHVAAFYSFGTMLQLFVVQGTGQRRRSSELLGLDNVSSKTKSLSVFSLNKDSVLCERFTERPLTTAMHVLVGSVVFFLFFCPIVGILILLLLCLLPLLLVYYLVKRCRAPTTTRIDALEEVSAEVDSNLISLNTVKIVLRASNFKKLKYAVNELDLVIDRFPGIKVWQRSMISPEEQARVFQASHIVLLSASFDEEASLHCLHKDNDSPSARLSRFMIERFPHDLTFEICFGKSRTCRETSARLVLLFFDRHMQHSSNSSLSYFSSTRKRRELVLAKLRRFKGSGCEIIPILVEGYNPKSYTSWWPEDLPEMSRHAIFVDFRVSHQWNDKFSSELMPQVRKYLEEWRGRSPITLDLEKSSKVPCPSCRLFADLKCHSYPRKPLEEQLAAQTSQLQDGREGEESSLRVCANGHRHSLIEILSQELVREAIPCPQCVFKGRAPPFCFERERCLLFFSEENRNRVGALFCEYCNNNGDNPNIRVLDIMPPSVFCSYNWGYENRTQQLVRSFVKQVELSTRVFCWLDIAGGIGGGQDHLQAMQEGVRRAKIFLLFLTDQYCKSINCKFEFCQAVKTGKYIIPVLLPEFSWTSHNNQGVEYYQHAAQASEDANTAQQGFEVPWRALKRFVPVPVSPEHISDGYLLQDSEPHFEILRRILSRMYRE